MSKAPINTKSSNYARDRETFLKDLRQFNDSKGISNRVPIVNGKEIDLYLFYLLVQQRGGCSKVNQQGGWDTFLKHLQLPNPCVNGSALLRRLYGASLERYERARGPPGRDDDNEEDDYRRGRGGPAPKYVHTAQAEWNRFNSRLAGPSERLALSLLSPMPNEQDFAVNVCTVLAADVSNRLPLTTTPHILDFLLAHAGIYNHPSLRDTIGRSYRETRGLSPDEFWRLRAGGGGARELADETKFLTSCSSERADLMVQALAAQNTLSDRLLHNPSPDKDLSPHSEEEELGMEEAEDSGWMAEAEDELLFAPALGGGARCVYTQRVLQVASIVRSLSFHEESLPLLAKHTTLLRFLLLCCNCWVGALRQMGLDTLGNIAQELVLKDLATCVVSRHVLSTVQAALVSADRARVLAALELLNKLAQNEANEEVLLRCLEPEVYEQTCALITLRDIMLLVCTLECVYALTSLGERACERALRATGLVHTLVSLLTVEAQSYGPKACILMRVVETVSGPAPADAQPQPAPAQPAQPPAKTPTSTPVKRQPAAEAPQAPASFPATPAPAAPPAPAPPPPAAPAVSSVQALHAQQQQVQENEQFALAWLRASYEPCAVVAGSGLDSTDLYRLYLQCCQKVGRKGLISPTHFPRLVRSVFGGTVGPNSVTIASGETQQVYVGIRARAGTQRQPQHAGGPSSPILKAQLTSNKPDASQPVNKPNTLQMTGSGAVPGCGAEAGASSTSLIKHLLAHKVSPQQPITHQVTQRQNQQQRLMAQPAAPANTPLVIASPANAPNLNDDPEELIKCSTITSAGVSSVVPHATNAQVSKSDADRGCKEPVSETQVDETPHAMSKSNKMLADLLEKKSSPPLQVPTIQITESGHIVQVKQESNPTTAIKESHVLPQHFVQIKNDQGQIIHFKNEQGQIVQIKNEHGQIFHIKNDSGQLMNQTQLVQMQQGGPILQVQPATQIITSQPTQIIQSTGQIMQQAPQIIQSTGQIIQSTGQIIQSTGQVIQSAGQILQPTGQIIQSTGQILQSSGQIIQSGGQILSPGPHVVDASGAMMTQVIQGSCIVQPSHVTETINIDSDGEPAAKKVKTEPGKEAEGVSKTAANLYAALAASALEDEEDLVQTPAAAPPPPAAPATPPVQITQPTMQVQQPVMQVQPLEVSGVQPQILLQEKPMMQQTQYVQQPMQIIATPTSAQGGLSYITQNIPGNMLQSHKTIIIVQGAGGPAGAPITLTVNNPGGLDESALNSLISQASEAITQQHMMQAGGAQKLVVQKNGSGAAQVVAVGGQQHAKPVQSSITQQRQQQPVAAKPASVVGGGGGGGGGRQVIRQPVMVGNTKIGEQEIVVRTDNKEQTKMIVSKSGCAGASAPAPASPAPAPAPCTPAVSSAANADTPWICHWKGCGKSFESAVGVFGHAARAHCPGGASGEAPCLWTDCDRVPRKTFALLNHLHDRHCTAEALRALHAARRSQHADDAAKSVSLVYPPNAALAALNKHAVDSLNPRELMEDNEGPVTKSIRLTAALILRNLVIYSNTARRHLRIYEHHLSSIALSSLEASRTIAQVLYDMNNI